jgi:multiple sugar transport system permease protein
VILCQLTICFPYCTWLLRAYFGSIPLELEESAAIDGAHPLMCLIRIIVPLATPGIVAAAIFSFIASWREFLYSFVIATDQKMHPLAIGLWHQAGADIMIWGDIMAWCALMVIPILIFFLLLQKQIVYGLTAGSVKG